MHGIKGKLNTVKASLVALLIEFIQLVTGQQNFLTFADVNYNIKHAQYNLLAKHAGILCVSATVCISDTYCDCTISTSVHIDYSLEYLTWRVYPMR